MANIRTSDPDEGWQWRLAKKLCSPPIATLRFTNRSPFVDSSLVMLEKQAFACIAMGFVRGYLNNTALLGDFMGGGTDMFTGMLAIFACYDFWQMNGSLLIMMLVWGVTNAAFFNVTLTLFPNMMYFVDYAGTKSWWLFFCFIADNILLIVNSANQASMCARVNSILNEVLPNWKNQMAYGANAGSSPPMAAYQQPFLPQPVATTRTQAPAFSTFSGSGQRLGGVAASRPVAPVVYPTSPVRPM
eukprot:TRINITY_DN3615_c1_g3_i1.p1 TRINITY_DN3615_c1_g3~~TRINITY_DN3615_c1_g3_i1.p1  ORF type:complete len:257 (+),score=37.42 TRINITY_DN3615_c1_g3_i1:40-771(+)